MLARDGLQKQRTRQRAPARSNTVLTPHRVNPVLAEKRLPPVWRWCRHDEAGWGQAL